MQIFDRFDTKLDEKELHSAVTEYGEGNAILTKKHRFFLMKPVCWLFFALGIFGVLIYFLYYQYHADFKILFWTLLSLYGVITLFWIIHSLIVIFQCIKKNQVYIDKISNKDLGSGAFESYIRHSIVSLILQVVLLIVNFVVVIIFKENSGLSEWLIVFGEFLLNLIFIWIIVITIYAIIDYEMDFNIFNCRQFVIYRQKGIFTARSTSIATSTIKIVIEENSTFWGAILGYGNISIHPEGSESAKPISLHYVTKPKILIKRLNEFIEESKRNINTATLS